MSGGEPIRTYLWVPARELLFEDPPRYPHHPGARLLGLALTPEEHRYLILAIGDVRLYLGPDQPTVTRLTRMIAAALLANASRRRDTDPDLLSLAANTVADWVQDCWEASGDALADLLLNQP